MEKLQEQDTTEHTWQATCRGYYNSELPAEVSVRDLLATPAGTPTQPMERHIAGHLVKRMIAESNECTSILRLPTEGQVSIQYMYELDMQIKLYILFLANQPCACARQPSTHIRGKP